MRKIGLVIPTTDNTFFSLYAHALEKCLNDSQLVICDCQNNAEREKEYLKMLSQICEGIIDISGLSELEEGLLPDNYPLVLVDRKPVTSAEVPWVGNDDEAAMYEATAYLLSKGCRNVLLMPGYIAEYHESPRVKGYKRALQDNSTEFGESYVLNRKGLKSSEEETAELIMDYFKEGRKIDAIITSSDRAAFGAMKALGKLGYYVPEDVRMISFDNSPYSVMGSPSVTAIDRNGTLIAQKAAEILNKLFDGETVPLETVIPVSLVKRDSTR